MAKEKTPAVGVTGKAAEGFLGGAKKTPSLHRLGGDCFGLSKDWIIKRSTCYGSKIALKQLAPANKGQEKPMNKGKLRRF